MMAHDRKVIKERPKRKWRLLLLVAACLFLLTQAFTSLEMPGKPISQAELREVPAFLKVNNELKLDAGRVFGREAPSPVHEYVMFQCGGCHLPMGNFDKVLPGFGGTSARELGTLALAVSEKAVMPIDSQRRAEFRWRLRRILANQASKVEF
jgi:hypothetical protein